MFLIVYFYNLKFLKCLVKNEGFKMFKMMKKYFYIRNFDMRLSF